MSNINFLIIIVVLLTINAGVQVGAYLTSKSAFTDQEKWSEVCVKGQLVYTIVLMEHSTAVNALNEDGKPVKCRLKSS